MIPHLSISIVTPRDIGRFTELISVFERVFEMKEFSLPENTHLQSLLEKPDFFAFTASVNNRVIGGLTCYILDQYYSPSPLVYIYDLAVEVEFQRQGVGKQLMQTTIDYYRQSGYEEVFVQAELADDYALDFYRATGANELPMVHFNYLLNQK